MTIAKEEPEGWQAEKHFSQRRYHYISGSFALCRGLGFYTGELMPWTGKEKGPKDCSACYKLAAKRFTNKEQTK